MNTKLLIILAVVLFHSCKTQQSQGKTFSAKVANPFEGELDYAKGGFELVQWQKSGEEITLGAIDESGEIHFNLPEYDIKALGRTHMEYQLESQFNMLRCKGSGDFDMMGQPLFKTPYEDVYSQMYPPMYIKKYGVNIAYVSPVSDEAVLAKGNFNKVIGDKYFWMYIDRALEFKETCIRETFQDPNLALERSADIQFDQGWNFIKSSVVELQQYGENNEEVMAKKILFTKSSHESKDVKWVMVRVMDEDKILEAKKEFEAQDRE